MGKSKFEKTLHYLKQFKDSNPQLVRRNLVNLVLKLDKSQIKLSESETRRLYTFGKRSGIYISTKYTNEYEVEDWENGNNYTIIRFEDPNNKHKLIEKYFPTYFSYKL